MNAALIAEIKAYATEHYENGWDVIVETMTDEAIAEKIGASKTLKGAVQKLKPAVDLWLEQLASTGSNVIVIRLPEPVEGRCNHPMPKASSRCGRKASHSGTHMTVEQVAKSKARSKAYAKARRATDDEYKARVNESSRKSHAKARANDPERAARQMAKLKALAEELGITLPAPAIEDEQQ